MARLTQHDKEFAISDEEEDCGKEADQGVYLYDSELDEAEGQLDTLNDVASRDEGTDLHDSDETSSQEEDDSKRKSNEQREEGENEEVAASTTQAGTIRKRKLDH